MVGSFLILFVVSCRQVFFSWLPPPAVATLKLLDAYCLRKFGIREASMSTLLTTIAAVLMARFFSAILSYSEKTHYLPKEEDATIISSKPKGSTSIEEFCLLCGPTNSGKTALFQALLSLDQHPQHDIPQTVTSMKAWEGSFVQQKGTRVHLIDFPGHCHLLEELPRVASLANRVVLGLDSTKPVKEAATFLYLLLTNNQIQSTLKSAMGRYGKNMKIPIMVACLKSDLPSSKTCLRIKLQLKQELERIRKTKLAWDKAQQKSQSLETNVRESELALGVPHRNLDFDSCDELPCQLSFVSVRLTSLDVCLDESALNTGLSQVREFVTNGSVEGYSSIKRNV
mmetsp:Transcript_11217/g.16142  ORF Transcript_11217/g.16142 Transcript_11217/m.16142 type:complete len:341 (+) Transcript_11217:58-1080(+)